MDIVRTVVYGQKSAYFKLTEKEAIGLMDKLMFRGKKLLNEGQVNGRIHVQCTVLIF